MPYLVDSDVFDGKDSLLEKQTTASASITLVHPAGIEHAVKTQRSLARSEVKATPTVENLANGVNKA